MRTDAREAVLKILYSRAINPVEEDRVRKGILKKLDEADYDFAVRLLETIDDHREKIVQIIDENITHFKEDRLYPVDRAVLTIAVAEIVYFDDVPAAVAASEAGDLASRYSTEKSADFVGGVLSGVIQQCTNS